MKAFVILGWLLLCSLFPADGQSILASTGSTNTRVRATTEKTADAILGEWLDDKQTVRIQVYKQSERYHARIVWLKDGSIAKNGTRVLENLQYTNKNSWQKGRLFYPRTDSWYDCRCTLACHNMMKIRVYLGTPILGKTIDFTRVSTAEGVSK